ncbi:rab effector Noc2 isoform X1 [Pongo pygmaeus]|nr:rab effector Noc2 isoform X1 [Pongo pygmaeus]XP_054313132.1 rab effector Noc2 isoform X1 [Pongo pygmaeus]XP_054391300.1 rab effector Noc2 isoform X1 [Pongo abelii]XP_054391301.1 rab effector Noc2 isoform X1 [Pongo abelii]XP_054391302.1 rab effector Noc2 isoform X1 [Pongo abelii]XP_054391303.1 rab effector Noc2 isoform X1 [Pongo abelii]
MADTIFGSGNDQWVCPNDRQLALRAKLQTGWSVHTYQTEKQRRSQHLSPAEVEIILQVIQRAERLDILEQQRIGRLVERLETMRRNVMGNGLSQCLLCGEVLGFLGSSSVFCKDCRKKVCTKCGIEASPGQKRPLWLCKICSEQREETDTETGDHNPGSVHSRGNMQDSVWKLLDKSDFPKAGDELVQGREKEQRLQRESFEDSLKGVWKRSGAWFYKGLPKYILPLKTPGRADDPHFRPLPTEPAEREPRSSETSRIYTWARGRVVSSDSDSDSDLSSSSLEDGLPPTGVRDRKGDKPWRGSGGSVEAPRMGFTHPLGHLSGSQSSLAGETGTGSADPRGGPCPVLTRRAPVKDAPGRAPAADAAPAGPSSCLG